MDLLTSDFYTLKKALAEKKISAREILGFSQEQIKKCNPQVNAFITLNEKVEGMAQKLDETIRRGEELPRLAGLTMGIKDMLCTRGLETTAASSILAGYKPPYSATVVERLEAEGALIVGKCNQDEFAMGSSNEASAFGLCKNPWNLDYVPGGSSGGSAAAVASRMALATIGTDTGGSIRQPASFCNVVGVKPTYGRVSRYGIIAFASSLDQAGPLTRSVRDAALICEVISGQDKRDATSSPQPVPQWSKDIKVNLKGLKVGLPKEYYEVPVDPEIQKIAENAIEWVKAAGAEIVEVSLPLTEWLIPVYYIIATSEASSNLARYDGVRFGQRADFKKVPVKNLLDFYCRTRGEGFGEEVKRRIMLGTYALSSGYYEAYYNKASQVRRLLQQDFQNVFKSCDVLLSAVTNTLTFKIGERNHDPLAMYRNDLFTTANNLAGLPGMSVPAGFSSGGLPVGVQLTSNHFNEQVLFNVGQCIEDAAQIKTRCPNVLQ